MIIAFSTEMFGRPNYFIDKIWDGFFIKNVLIDPDALRNEYIDKYRDLFGRHWDVQASIPAQSVPKMHTLRIDRNNRWRKGRRLQMCVKTRSKFHFQFAPDLVCTSTQKVTLFKKKGLPTVIKIDGRILSAYEKEVLARRDGFADGFRFDDYFNPQIKFRPLVLKLIHWTDIKY